MEMEGEAMKQQGSPGDWESTGQIRTRNELLLFRRVRCSDRSFVIV